MRTALIGHTGYVGGTLLRQAGGFDDLYNSTNVEEIAGREYDLLVVSGMPAEKWKANRDPEADRRTLDRLSAAVGGARARKVVVVSTVDVYPHPVDVDEDTPLDPSAGQAYGRHRLLLERYVQERFDTLVLRLPGLFGRGLKKNVIYDFLHGNQVGQVHADAVFQFYDLRRLWDDMRRALDAGLPVANLAVEPTSVADVAREGFGIDFANRPAGVAPARYDMHTRHAALFGGAGRYVEDATAVLAGLRAFVAAERAGPPQAGGP